MKVVYGPCEPRNRVQMYLGPQDVRVVFLVIIEAARICRAVIFSENITRIVVIVHVLICVA